MKVENSVIISESLIMVKIWYEWKKPVLSRFVKRLK